MFSTQLDELVKVIDNSQFWYACFQMRKMELLNNVYES